MRRIFRTRWQKGLGVAALVLVALGVTAALSFGPLVRREVAREASLRDLDVEVSAVRPAWGAVRLLGVHVRPRGTTGIAAVLDEVRVESDHGHRRVSVLGGHVDVEGAPSAVKGELAAWRARHAHPAVGGATATPPAVEIRGLGLLWDAGELGTIEADGMSAGRDGDAPWVRAERVHFARASSQGARGVDVRATGAHVALDSGLALSRAHADTADVTLTPAAASPPVGGAVPRVDAPTPTPSTPPASASASKRALDLAALRARADQVAARVAERLPEGATVDVGALVVHASIDVGPAALSVTHTPGSIDTVLTAHDGGEGHPPIDLRATLALGPGDDHVRFDGGPLTLAGLGLHDRTFGLTDLDAATIAGHADAVLAGDGGLLSYDVDLRVRGLGVDQRRLASSVVHGLDVDLRARGRLAEGGALTVDDAEVALGSARMDLSGRAQLEGPPSLDMRFSVPRSWCKAMIENLPESLVPTVHGTQWDGDFEAHGHFAFDARKIDDVTLDYAIDDQCKVVGVPERLSREHFKQAFQHTLYDPEGRPREETTGPGTPRWTPLYSMGRYMPIAVVMTEDGGFYRKDGFNHPQIKLAVSTDLKERRFARGASTLIMQLAKNLFLARDKTIARKLEQVLLTEVIAQTYPKDDVLELYLNIVEFGPDVYGARDAAVHYFGKGPWGLTLGESLFLAAMLPAPVKLHGMRGLGEAPPAYVDSIYHLVDLARESGLVTQAEADEAKTQPIRFAGYAPPPKPTPTAAAGSPAKRDARVD